MGSCPSTGYQPGMAGWSRDRPMAVRNRRATSLSGSPQNGARGQLTWSNWGRPRALCGLARALCGLARQTTMNADERLTADIEFMGAALELAREAERWGEVPVGAVVVVGGEVWGRGFNSPIQKNDPTAHAEILALREAGLRAGNYRLEGATMYATLEPCVMCAGALVAARVSRLVFGARDLRFGGVRSKFRLADAEVLNHRVEIVEGILGADCTELIQRFFAGRRT